jgi:major membrane immunogen (membrane-anchored lipoprotein)
MRTAEEVVIRHEFRLYFADLSADARREGYHVDREETWQAFIDNKIADGQLTRAAQDWRY